MDSRYDAGLTKQPCIIPHSVPSFAFGMSYTNPNLKNAHTITVLARWTTGEKPLHVIASKASILHLPAVHSLNENTGSQLLRGHLSITLHGAIDTPKAPKRLLLIATNISRMLEAGNGKRSKSARQTIEKAGDHLQREHQSHHLQFSHLRRSALAAK